MTQNYEPQGRQKDHDGDSERTRVIKIMMLKKQTRIAKSISLATGLEPTT